MNHFTTIHTMRLFFVLLFFNHLLIKRQDIEITAENNDAIVTQKKSDVSTLLEEKNEIEPALAPEIDQNLSDEIILEEEENILQNAIPVETDIIDEQENSEPIEAPKQEPISFIQSKQEQTASPAKSKKKNVRSISITNSIEDDMLGYKHWTGTYTPKIFILHVNGKKINPGATKSIDLFDNLLVVRFEYDYGYNIKRARGASEVTFTVDKNATECDITISWNNEWRIIIDNATPKEEELCEFQEG